MLISGTTLQEMVFSLASLMILISSIYNILLSFTLYNNINIIVHSDNNSPCMQSPYVNEPSN